MVKSLSYSCSICAQGLQACDLGSEPVRYRTLSLRCGRPGCWLQAMHADLQKQPSIATGLRRQTTCPAASAHRCSRCWRSMQPLQPDALPSHSIAAV